MSMSKARRQMPGNPGRAGTASGEAEREPATTKPKGPRHDTETRGHAACWAALTRENLQRAWKKVRANKG
jgi:RNA-directed DNA polymerase